MVISYGHMNILVHVMYRWHLRGILVFGIHMAITCFKSHNADGAINDTLHFSC